MEPDYPISQPTLVEPEDVRRNIDDQAFYEPLGSSRYRATRATQSPWNPEAQHGGPPTALIAHVIARLLPRNGMRIARVAAEFLGLIPLDEVTVHARVTRAGKKIELVEAEIVANGRCAVSARVWRIATRSDEMLAQRAAEIEGARPVPPDLLDGGQDESAKWGYSAATEWRYLRGAMGAIGAAAAWMRPCVALVAGEPWAPVERILVAADSANGISGELPFDGSWLFAPPSFSIALQREPRGEWVLLEARTTLAPDGIGVCAFSVSDPDGLLGAGTQALLVERLRPTT